ncbi:hypothetical protein [Singulisphaera sp. GP187]|uniref:hypothetical protein n=1 Tax=Singulisphaera sp. GP187 TaxID=1882752 RepID=UPI00094174E7|nr:hypothetical protein [Singulisphaera sp. GP187]
MTAADADAAAELRNVNQRLHEAIVKLPSEAESRVLIDKDKLRHLASAAFAMGVNSRQVDDLLGVLLAAQQVSDHSTLGRRVRT